MGRGVAEKKAKSDLFLFNKMKQPVPTPCETSALSGEEMAAPGKTPLPGKVGAFNDAAAGGNGAARYLVGTLWMRR